MVLLLGAGFLALTLPHLGVVPIERAEIYFLDAARAMVESGDYLVPRYQGQAFYDKPVLSYWLMAGSFRLFGTTLGAARAVSVLAAAGCLALTAVLGRRLFGSAAALTSTAILATTMAFLSFARLAMSDMLLCFSVLGTVVAGDAGLRYDHDRWRHAALLGVCLGCGFLTKGPIALILAGAGLVALGWAHRKALKHVRWLHAAATAAVCAAIGLSWFTALWLREGVEPLRYFFLQENLERFAGARYDTHRGPLYFFGVYLAEGLPWSLFLPLAIIALWRESASSERRDALALGAWMILMLVPLTLSRGKIDYYILPLYPAASLLIARFLVRPWSAIDRRLVRAILVVLALLLLAVTHLVVNWTPILPEAWLPAGNLRLALPGAAALGAALMIWAAVKGRSFGTLVAPAAASVFLFGTLAHTVLPAFRRAQPTAAAVTDIGRELRYRPDARIVYCEDPARLQRDVLFDVRVPMIERCDLLTAAASGRPMLFLLSPEERAFLSRVEPMRDVAEYTFLPATTATLDGLAAGVTPRRVVIAANYLTQDPVAVLKMRKERRRAIRRVLEERERAAPESRTPPDR